LIVSALVAVNAIGDLVDAKNRTPLPTTFAADARVGENTTIGVIVCNARLSKAECLLLAQGGHDGLARALEPAHSTVDGDAVVGAATGQLEEAVEIDRVRVLGARAFEAAIRAAVTESSDTNPARPS
jgi:L-aminopeptidase/D-esterase-like protein